IASGEIHQYPLRGRIRPTVHAGTPFAIIHAVATLIKEDDGHGWPRVQDVCESLVFAEARTKNIRVATVEPTQHRHTPLARKYLARIGATGGNAWILIIPRASPNPGVVGTIRPEQAFLHHDINIPVERVPAIDSRIACPRH